MEENQKKKGVGGFAVGLTIICILGLAIMGYFIYYLLNARENDKKEMQSLRDDISAIKTSIVNKEDNEKDDGDVSDILTPPELSEDFIKSQLQKCLDLESAKTNSTDSVFERLGLKTSSYEEKATEGTGFRTTNIDYDEFEEAMLQYMTKECFEEKWGQIFKDVDGFVGYTLMGGSGEIYTVNSITKTDTGYTADITSSSDELEIKIKVIFTFDEKTSTISSYKFDV